MYANPPSIFDDPLTQEGARMTSPCAWPKQEERHRDICNYICVYTHIEYQYSYIMAASILVADILRFHGWFYVKCEDPFFEPPSRVDLRLFLGDINPISQTSLIDVDGLPKTNLANRNPLVSCFSSTIFDGRIVEAPFLLLIPLIQKYCIPIYTVPVYTHRCTIYSRLFHCIPLPTDFPQDPVFEKLLLSRLKADDLSCLGRSMGGSGNHGGNLPLVKVTWGNSTHKH